MPVCQHFQRDQFSMTTLLNSSALSAVNDYWIAGEVRAAVKRGFPAWVGGTFQAAFVRGFRVCWRGAWQFLS